ncbi:MAG: hypothetical protein J5864_00270, partial [Oscillospiraceae bacterium]|nr:hypothetical protein [Oscillospiraceae bacterium]
LYKIFSSNATIITKIKEKNYPTELLRRIKYISYGFSRSTGKAGAAESGNCGASPRTPALICS